VAVDESVEVVDEPEELEPLDVSMESDELPSWLGPGA
jgi:hypothetical protein